MNYLGRLTLLTILFGSFLLGCTSSEKSGNETPLEPIVLQLKWTHQFQFAGYYAALEQGFFKEEGLDVTIVAGGPGINVDDEVISGRATYGVLASELVKKWQDNKSVVLIAPIIQHSIRALMVREDSEIFSPHDLIGKRVVITVNEDPEIKTMFLNEGITPEMVDFEPQNATSEARFLNGEVDAVVGSIANQPYQFKLNGVKVRTIRPINYGVDFYGDSLFTSQQEAMAHPQRVEAFLRAVVRGWDYAFENQDETIALIRTQYAPEKTIEQLTFEAQTLYSLTLPDLVEIGHNNPERWKRIVDTYIGVGLMEPVTSLEDFFYSPLSTVNYTWLRWLGGGLGFALMILAVILVWNAQLRKMVIMRTNALEKQFEELQQTEQALRQSESLLHRSQEQAGLGSFTWELQNDSLAWSRNMFAIHGFNQDTFSGSLSEVSNQLIHPDDRARVQTEIEKMIIAKQVWPMEFRVIRSDGVERIMQSSGGFEFDTQLQPVRCIGIHQDITERKRTEAEIQKLNAELEQRVIQRTVQLEAANQELEAFSYSVSHDLRSPLRGIDGWSHALLEDYGSQLDEQAKTYLDRVRAETQRMGNLIDDLLQLSRLTRAEMHTAQVDLSAIAHRVATQLQETEPIRQVDFVIQPELNAQGDAQLLEIALTNLLGNAFKFTGKTPQARIELGKTRVEGQDAFFVRDNGAGFEMAYAKKLFGAFQRLHKASEFPGTGVGLTTVQRIVHRHGGRIWAEAALQQGATFYFTLEERL